MYFQGEIETEIRAKGEHFSFKTNNDIEDYMKYVEATRPSVYPHASSVDCITKGVNFNDLYTNDYLHHTFL